MQHSFRINRVSTHPVEVEVSYNGDKARAMLPEMEVEMHDETSKHGSITLHFRSQAEIEEAKSLFMPGGMIMATFSQATPESITTEAETSTQ